MNRTGLTVPLILLGAVALVAYLTLFTVEQTHSSSLEAQLPMKTSGLLSVKASRNTIALRRSYWGTERSLGSA